MSNSSLVSYTKLSPNHYNGRGGYKITKITPHHMSGNLTVETCGNVFASSARQASSNYGIGSDGRIAMYVEEKNAAWTSSNYANDCQAVTIEVANSSTGGNWPISDKAWTSLVNLCVDICKRNGIKSLKWTGDKNGTLTCHYFFSATDCPGPYLKSRMGKLANEVNARLKGSTTSSSSNTASSTSDAFKSYTDSSIAGTYTVTASNGVNIRTAPKSTGNKKGSIVKAIAKGKTLTLGKTYYKEDGYYWGETAIDGKTRYVAIGTKKTGDFLKKKSSTSTAKPPTSSKKSITTIAKEVIAGKWGNGLVRKAKLKAAGYDYNAVQKEVNRQLK